MTDAFRWQDGERLIVFGAGVLAQAPELLGSDGYVLLSTPRALAAAPSLVPGASAVHEVGPGKVDELAGALRDKVHGPLLVALGGGRVIDVAKALAAAGWAGSSRVAAIPTTLSGAEMTGVHRHAAGVPLDTPRVRPALVINDPVLCASQPRAELAQSAGNALGHAGEALCTTLANPVASLAALESARLIAAAFEPAFAGGPEADVERDSLALGALLAGYSISSAWYGLHHVLSQTLARLTPAGHGGANVIMLPHSLRALAERAPVQLGRLGEALGEDPPAFAARLAALTGTTRLRDVGVTEDQLDQCADEAATRPELHLTPPAASHAELRTLYEAAY